MKKVSTLLLAVLIVNIAMAQEGFLEDNQEIAKLTLKDGTVKEGIVEFDTEPYRTQNSIRYFDMKLLDAGPVKNKQKEKYFASDIKEIKTKKRTFDVKKYADMSALSFGTLGGKSYILEVLKKGKLKLYNYYAEIGVKPELLIGKDGDEKVKAVASTALLPYIEDCPQVKEKFEKGEYGNDPKQDSALANDNLKFINQLVDDYNATCQAN
jgi:hypothetical protein